MEQAIGRFGAEAHPLTGAAVARPRRSSTQGGAAGQAGIAARDMGDQTPAARPGTAGGHGSIHGAGGHGVFRGAEGHEAVHGAHGHGSVHGRGVTSGGGPEGEHGARQPYNPTYDPLVHPTPGHGQQYSPTYWIDTAGTPPQDDGPIDSDRDVDVAIIGSGFTGLSTAIALAQEHGIRAVVLEANRVAWGCTTRNGGQAQCASGRLKRSEWIARWGLDTALALHAECVDAMDYFRAQIADIDCDAQPGGHLYIAHRPQRMPVLEKEAKLLRETFHYDAQILDADTLRGQYIDDHEAAGAMQEPEGIGVHPAKLAFGYVRKARALGVKIHPASPVLSWERQGEGVNERHLLRTPGGVVRARAVGVATGGYTSQTLNPQLKDRIMPILANSIVTRPLAPAEIEANGLRTFQIITDTRVLRHYYRVLPDGRLQIGTRSAITGSDATAPRHLDLVRAGLARKFPGLRDVDIDYYWWGWVDVSHDMMPRIVQPDPHSAFYYALGYGGNGVSYSAQAGRRLAQHIAGKTADVPKLPIFEGVLPYPDFAGLFNARWLAPFRRLGQWGLYHWYHLKDERL